MKILVNPLRILIAINLLAAAMLFPLVQPVQALAAFSINTTTDTHDASAGNGICADSGGFCSPRAAIEEANALTSASSINLPAGAYNLTLGELSIAPNGGKTIDITGAGAATTIIQQTDTTNRVMNIDSGSAGNTDVTISGVTIRGGRDAADSLGGAGILAGSVSSASKDQLTLQDCVISNNQNTSPSTGFTGQPGGGVFMNGGDLTVTNCTFSNNSSANSQGGAIAFVQPDAAAPVAVLTVTGSTFNNNSMSSTAFPVLNGGGAIWINTIAANTGANAHTITSSTFTGNTAGAGGVGGAILTQLGTTNITNSNFTGNTASAASSAGGQGGAIYNDSGILNVSYSRMAGNTAAGGGSGIYNHSSNNASTTAPNNWWGCNGGPGATGCDTTANDTGSGVITATPWIVLTNTPSPASINAAGAPAPNAATLTASFLQNSAGQVLTPANISALTGLPVAWENAVLGALSNSQATIQANGTATATFTAGAQGGAGSADARVDSSTASANITIVAYVDLSVTLANAPDPVTAGANLTYTIAFAYAGPHAASTVLVTQSTPPNTTFVSAAVSTGAGWTVSAPVVGGTGAVTFTKATVAASETANMTIVVKVNASVSSGSVVTGTVTAASSIQDTNSGNNSASATTTVQTLADLVVTKTAPALVAVGESLVYTITLTNNGPSDAQAVTLTDTLPTGTTFVSQSQASGPSFTLSNTGSSISNTIASLATGATASFTVQTNVNAGLAHGTVLSNTATASTTTTDPNTANNSSTATTTVKSAPVITSADHVTFNLGETGLFTVTTSAYPLAVITASGALPSGVTFQDNGDGTAVLSWAPALGTAGPYPITITASNGALPNAVQSFTLTVSKATPLIDVEAQPNPVMFDQPVTLTATLTASLTMPTDTVTFYIDGGSVGTDTLDASGAGTLVTGPLLPGSQVVRVVYGGDQNFATVEKSITLLVIQSRYYLPIIAR